MNMCPLLHPELSFLTLHLGHLPLCSHVPRSMGCHTRPLVSLVACFSDLVVVQVHHVNQPTLPTARLVLLHPELGTSPTRGSSPPAALLLAGQTAPPAASQHGVLLLLSSTRQVALFVRQYVLCTPSFLMDFKLPVRLSSIRVRLCISIHNSCTFICCFFMDFRCHARLYFL